MRVPIRRVAPTMSKEKLVNADDEWSPLKAVIVGRAEHSCYPSEPRHLTRAFVPPEFLDRFRPHNPFSAEIVENAQQELDTFADVLRQHGVTVYRPDEVDWLKHGGYTGAMPRDRLLTVGNTLIESIPAWGCRQKEIELGFSTILSHLSHPEDAAWRVFRAPVLHGRDTIYNGKEQDKFDPAHDWAISNTRPAFDAADFMRFGKHLLGQLSHVTNQKGIDYLRSVLPEGYTLELIEPTYATVMHIDTTLLPLRKGLLVFNPEYITEERLRGLKALEGWELHAYPFTPKETGPPNGPEQPMASGWLVLNGLSLDENRIFVEESATEFAEWIKEKFGIEAIMLPFKHVNSIGGSFHCATVDLVRG
ncbi:amidinotransferase [Cordyceps militaris CM01]|uniref:Glycine amidinotransferase, mitochondrial n=2 Tax=Cordyceps militaris TaxID=73501 RepID=G3JFZ4_CORMM|nr:amidinotransferase [Cordyceps militaris CM01]ATY64238.1 Amidinotransferase family [Cordyceps militaris]EGX93612.1 amidinotransferase [Cordyceps militaris CM01]